MIQHHKTLQTYLTRVNGKLGECPFEFNPTHQDQSHMGTAFERAYSKLQCARPNQRTVFVSLSLFLHLSEAHFPYLSLSQTELFRSVFWFLTLCYIRDLASLLRYETLRLQKSNLPQKIFLFRQLFSILLKWILQD